MDTKSRKTIELFTSFHVFWLQNIEIPETKRFIPKGFELGTTLS